MPIVVGIRFKDSGKTYYFDPQQYTDLQQGDHVVVETVRGPELAKIALGIREISESEIVGELKPVVRRAEPSDFERLSQLNAHEDDLLKRCSEKIKEHDLPMRLVKAEYSFDGSRLTFYFTAEKRVDFRNLVRDLARTFRTRIELRQIGPRDEAKLLGGIGPCGRLLCCATFLPDYARVSIKMAKDQDLPLNPTKISGVCGRLLCCLSYEHEQYLEVKAQLPRKGTWVQTPDGPGEVVIVNVIRETVTVELAGSGVHEEFRTDQLKEATRQVADLARSRNEEGITPAAKQAAQRPAKHTGERRFLRDEIEDPEVLDALAMLEDGLSEKRSSYDLPDLDDDLAPPSGKNPPRTPNRPATLGRNEPQAKPGPGKPQPRPTPHQAGPRPDTAGHPNPPKPADSGLPSRANQPNRSDPPRPQRRRKRPTDSQSENTEE
jgi:cell fate regulator YaaT (PSP1 superfamily)